MENHPRYYPFTRYREEIRTVQGIYLAQSTPQLYDIFLEALGIQTAISIPELSSTSEANVYDPHSEYREGRQYKSERYFFSRNPQLAIDAKRHYGFSCEACGFNFEQIYGEVGEGYIEAHHLNPLSERSEVEWTTELTSTLEEVSVLCSNCHRMIHRTREALSIEELKKVIHKASNPDNPTHE